MIDDATYEANEIPMPQGSGLLLMSDGIVEQFGGVKQDDGTAKREQFEVSRVLECMKSRGSESDLVNCLFEELEKHAGSASLSDDATIVWVRT